MNSGVQWFLMTHSRWRCGHLGVGLHAVCDGVRHVSVRESGGGHYEAGDPGRELQLPEEQHVPLLLVFQPVLQVHPDDAATEHRGQNHHRRLHREDAVADRPLPEARGVLGCLFERSVTAFGCRIEKAAFMEYRNNRSAIRVES